MQKHFLLLQCTLLFTLNSFCQSIEKIDSVLKKDLSPQSTNDGRWVYYAEFGDIQQIDKPAVAAVIPQFTFYKVNLTNYLGYHINRINCLILFNSKTSKASLVVPMWYSDISADFLELFIGKRFSDSGSIMSFISQLQTLLEVGSTGRFENSFYDKERIIFDYSIIQNGKRKLWRKITVQLSDNTIRSFKSTNPILSESKIVE